MTTRWGLRAARPAFQRRNRKSPLILRIAAGAHGRTDNGSPQQSHHHTHVQAPRGHRPPHRTQVLQVRQPQRRLGACSPSVNAHSAGAKKPRLEGVVATAAASASSNAADDANKGMPETKHSDGPQEVASTSLHNPTASSAAHALRHTFLRWRPLCPGNNRMPAPPSSSHVPAAFAPFIRSAQARLAPPTINSGAGGAAGAGATSVADVRAGNEDQQDGGRAFFDTTVAKWKDGAGSTAAGCMLRYVQEKRRRHADILQAATRVAAEIARAPRTQTPRGDRVVAMAIAHLSTAVQLGLDADRLVQIAQTTTCELTTECLLNSCVVRQAFIHFPATICGFVQPRRGLLLALHHSRVCVVGSLVQELPIEACSVSHSYWRRRG